MTEVEILSIMEACNSSPIGGNHSGVRTTYRILQCGYLWPTIHQHAYAYAFVKSCDLYQRYGGISWRQELPMHPILVIELFDVLGN